VCDQSILLTVPEVSRGLFEEAPPGKYYDVEIDKTLVFLTNNFLLPADTIAQLYKQRMAGGALLQVDQTALRIEELFRYFGDMP